jgi:hypothetical protein
MLIFCFNIVTKTQTMRYFRFSVNCGHGNWQDSSFIASTSDQILIDTVIANLSRPLNERKFINGKIDYGSGGINHNGSHWFLWHFIPDQWTLTEMAIELCDGCPYSDVDADTAPWVGVIGQFCPWSGKPVGEISNPSGTGEKKFENTITLYPNPSSGLLNIKRNIENIISVTIYNSTGQNCKTFMLLSHDNSLDISDLKTGLYLFKITDGYNTEIKKIIIEKN